MSGAQADRRELLRMLKDIMPGDVVTVTRIDRLARSTFDLFATVKRIVDTGGQFRSLAEPRADTATSTGRLMIAILGGLADVERDLIRTRTAEGRSRAKARGKLFPLRKSRMDLAGSTEQSVLPFSDVIHARSNRLVARRPTRQTRRPSRSIDPQVVAALHGSSRVLFLDVETTGLSRYYDELTLVGWVLDGVYRVHIAGDDPEPLLSALRTASVLVTFNGTLFDLAFLTKSFPELSLPKIHADLRFLAKRAGLTGGQKAIEKELGIQIRKGVEDLDGAQAVLLWHRYLRGDFRSLRRLIDYNRCDVIAMRHILDEVLERLITGPDFWSAGYSFSQQTCTISGWAQQDAELPSASRLDRPKSTFGPLFAATPAENATIVGIDLTGSETRPSGWCVLCGAIAETEMVRTDDEMVKRILAISPALVSIDSPLSIPFGRSRVEDDDPARAEFGAGGKDAGSRSARLGGDADESRQRARKARGA